MTTQHGYAVDRLGPAVTLPAHRAPEHPSVPGPFRRPLVVAHRGYSSRAPENTIAAVRLAVAHGADLVEVDVHATRDGVPVVLHDATLDRTTTGAGPVSEWTFRDLRESAEIIGVPGERVPTLAEVLAITRGRVPLAIEVKAAGIAEQVLDVVARRSARRHVSIWSFRRSIIRDVRDLAPDVHTALLYRGARHGTGWTPGEFLYHAGRLGVSAVSFFPEDVEPGLVGAARDRGLEVYTGTVNDGLLLMRVMSSGVDAVITDEPLGLRAMLAA